MHLAEKGGRTQCFGTLSWRFFNKATRRRRHESTSALRHADAWPAARDDCRRGVACPRTWQGSDWRYRLRLERLRAGGSQAGMKPVIHSKPERKKNIGWTARSIGNATWSRSFSTDSNDFAPSPRATRRLRATISHSSNSVARGCGLAKAELGAPAAGVASEAA